MIRGPFDKGTSFHIRRQVRLQFQLSFWAGRNAMGFSIKSRCCLKLSLLLLTALLCSRSASLAQTWDGDNGNSGDSNWSNALNWNPNGAPSNNGLADIIFAGPNKLTPNLDINWDVNSVTFNNTAGPFAIGGSTLTIRAGG